MGDPTFPMLRRLTMFENRDDGSSVRVKCENCRYWERHEEPAPLPEGREPFRYPCDGTCSRLPKVIVSSVEVDEGLSGDGVYTPADFGCSLFEARE